jgi:hypothetical protein
MWFPYQHEIALGLLIAGIVLAGMALVLAERILRRMRAYPPSPAPPHQRARITPPDGRR